MSSWIRPKGPLATTQLRSPSLRGRPKPPPYHTPQSQEDEQLRSTLDEVSRLISVARYEAPAGKDETKSDGARGDVETSAITSENDDLPLPDDKSHQLAADQPNPSLSALVASRQAAQPERLGTGRTTPTARSDDAGQTSPKGLVDATLLKTSADAATTRGALNGLADDQKASLPGLMKLSSRRTAGDPPVDLSSPVLMTRKVSGSRKLTSQAAGQLPGPDIQPQVRETPQSKGALQEQVRQLRKDNEELRSQQQRFALVNENLRKDRMEERAHFEMVNRELRESIASLEGEVLRLKEANLELDRSSRVQNSQLSGLQKDNDVLQRQRSRLEQQLSHAIDRASHAEADHGNVAAQLDALTQENSKYVRAVMDYRSKVAELSAHNDALCLQQETRDAAHGAEVKSLLAKLGVYEHQINGLREDLQKADERVAKVEMAMSHSTLDWERRVHTEVDKARSELSAIWEKSMASMKASHSEEVQSQLQRHDTHMGEIRQKYEEQLHMLRDEIARMGNERTSMAAALTKAQSDADGAQSRLTSEIASLQQQLSSSQGETKALTDKLAASQKAHDATKAAGEKLHSRLDELTFSLTRASRDLAAAQAKSLAAERATTELTELVHTLETMLNEERTKALTCERDMKLALARSTRLYESGNVGPLRPQSTARRNKSLSPDRLSLTHEHGEATSPGDDGNLGTSRAIKQRLHLELVRNSARTAEPAWETSLRRSGANQPPTSLLSRGLPNDAFIRSISPPRPPFVTGKATGETQTSKSKPSTAATARIGKILWPASRPNNNRVESTPSLLEEQLSRLKTAYQSCSAALQAASAGKAALQSENAELKTAVQKLEHEVAGFKKSLKTCKRQLGHACKHAARLQESGVSMWQKLLLLFNILAQRISDLGEEAEVNAESLQLPPIFAKPFLGNRHLGDTAAHALGTSHTTNTTVMTDAIPTMLQRFQSHRQSTVHAPKGNADDDDRSSIDEEPEYTPPYLPFIRSKDSKQEMKA